MPPVNPDTPTSLLIQLWDVATGQARGAPLLGHKSRVWHVAFTAEGDGLLSTSGDKTLMRWSAAPTRQVLQEHGSAVRSLAVSHDGKILAAAGDEGRSDRECQADYYVAMTHLLRHEIAPARDFLIAKSM